jgi:glycosyltransferase 2 family protein
VDVRAAAAVSQSLEGGESPSVEVLTTTDLMSAPGPPGDAAQAEAVAHRRPTDEVLVQPFPEAAPVRRASDMLRLLVALAVLICAGAVAALDQAHVRLTERAVLDSVVTLPAVFRDWLSALVQLGAVLFPAACLAIVVGGRRLGLAWRLLLAAAIATTAAVVVTHLLLAPSRPPKWTELLAGTGGVFNVTFPPVAWFSGVTAMLTVVIPGLSPRWRRGLLWVTLLAVVAEVAVGGFLPLDAVVAAALGVTIGALVSLAFGGPADRPTAQQIVSALQECGVELRALEKLSWPASGPDMFRATTPGGASLIVKVFADEDRDRDRLSRLYHSLMVRHAQDDRTGTTVQSTAEHAVLAMVTAARAGARVPEPVVAYPVAAGHSSHGALAVWVDVGGRPLDSFSSEEIPDSALADLWHSVSLTQQHRIAHRQLRTDNVIVDDDDHAWLIGLGHAELGASDRQLDIDVAELMVSLAAKVGADRAVSSAIAGLGAPAVEAAEGYVQPLALSGPTRAKARHYDQVRSVESVSGRAKSALRPGGRPDLLRDVRAEVASATGTPPVKLERLSRFTWKRALALLGAFVIIYVLLPQLSNAGAAIRALQNANWWWVLAASPAIFVVMVFATLLQLGAIPAELPFRPTYVVELGGSFLNKVTPNGVGGMALSFRYLQKAGVGSGAATASVGLMQLVSIAANLVLVSAFFAATGRKTPVHFSLAGHEWVFIVVAAVLAGLGLLALTKPGRRFFHDKIWRFLRSAGVTVAQVAKSPRHVTLTLGGAVGWPLVEVVAFALCVHAVGGALPFVEVGAVYLGGNLLASAAPTPGGLGALEAALTAGLSGLGMPVGEAASAVLIFRLLTFWLSIPVGWAGLRFAERHGYV